MVRKMKKVLALALVAALLLLASCAGGGNAEETTTASPETTEKASEDVKITMSKASLADPEKYVSDMEGYGAEVADMSDAGGGYIVTFSREEYEDFLKARRAVTEKALKDIEADESNYIEKIEFTEDFRDLKILVNREAYNIAENKSFEYVAGTNVIAYQKYVGIWQNTFVKVYYSDNEEQVTSFNIPFEISMEQ